VGPGPMGPGLGHKRNREREARSLGISGSDFECKCHEGPDYRADSAQGSVSKYCDDPEWRCERRRLDTDSIQSILPARLSSVPVIVSSGRECGVTRTAPWMPEPRATCHPCGASGAGVVTGPREKPRSGTQVRSRSTCISWRS
jgi:hypothetical protein